MGKNRVAGLRTGTLFALAVEIQPRQADASRTVFAAIVNRSAQIQAPEGLTNTDFECRYQMSHPLTLKGLF